MFSFSFNNTFISTPAKTIAKFANMNKLAQVSSLIEAKEVSPPFLHATSNVRQSF